LEKRKTINIHNKKKQKKKQQGKIAPLPLFLDFLEEGKRKKEEKRKEAKGKKKV